STLPSTPNSVRAKPGHAGPDGSATPTNSADHSSSPKNPLRTTSGSLHGDVTPSVPVTHTSMLCRECGLSGANGQSTNTDSLESSVAVCSPFNRTSAPDCRQSGTSVATCQLSRGCGESASGTSLRRSIRTLLMRVLTYISPRVGSALDCTGCHSGDDLTIEEYVHH